MSSTGLVGIRLMSRLTTVIARLGLDQLIRRAETVQDAIMLVRGSASR
jgi:hypothetical protein